ncbi:hypothetical protein KCU62_g8652, partial [Aureobasidium sp. EXF-3399]
MYKGKNPRAATQETEMSLQALQANRDLWYKIQVLLYDLCNIVTDRTAESRTLATTDELYISAPYLAADEAALVKQTRISPPTLQEISEFELLEDKQDTISQDPHVEEPTPPVRLVTIEEISKDAWRTFSRSGGRVGMHVLVIRMIWVRYILRCLEFRKKN